MLSLLENPERPDYIRRTDPPLPEGITTRDETVNRQGEIADRTGLVFPIPPPG